jgi:enamine deaminase RidA (YjgF/YER057c/UK114 family)
LSFGGAVAVFYSAPSQPSAQVGGVTISGAVALSIVVDNGLTLAVKNITATVDASTFAIGSQANDITHATVYLNIIQDVGHEFLVLDANAQLFSDIAAARLSNGTVTLTSTGSATLAEWQAALRSVTYQDNATIPTTGVRNITFDYNDGIHASYTSS